MVIVPWPAAVRTFWYASRDASAVAAWAGVWVWIAERYWVPTSLPWRKPWVGSWDSQKVFRRRSYGMTFGS